MNKIPFTCVDNFYSNPDAVREFALSLPYDNEDNKIGFYPGVRTNSLSDIDSDFFNQFLMRFSSVFYNLDDLMKMRLGVYTTFHKIYPYDIKDSIKNMGWVHTDSPYVISGIIYLNKNPGKNTGTSLYRKKDDSDFDKEYEKSSYAKRDLYSTDKRDISEEEYKNCLEKNNSMFEETLKVENVYNRMIAFDSDVWHSINSMAVDDEFRLTQVFFVSSLDLVPFPLERMKHINVSRG
jgi:hypothetical protein